MPRKVNESLVRVNYNCPKHFVERLDADAEKLGFSRSNMITSIINQYYLNIDGQQIIRDARYMIDKGAVMEANPDMYSVTDDFKNALAQSIQKNGGKKKS